MDTNKTKRILGVVLTLLMVLLTISAKGRPQLQAAPETPTYSYSLSPTRATMSTFRVTLSITNLLGQTPPSSTWYGPDGNEVSQGCVGGQQIRDYIYSGGSLFEVRDYFYISACSRDPGRYTVSVGSDYAGSFKILTHVYLPLVSLPPGPPRAFSKVSPADGITGQNPLNLTLDWEESPGADSYAYCYDAIDDETCTNWVDTGADSQAEINGLSEHTTYYWQARATNSLGVTYANGADTAYWPFTTGEVFTGTWTEMTADAGWSGRRYHTSVALPDGSIVLMGGYDGSNRYNDVWRSTDQGATWTQMTAAADWAARDNHTSVVLSDGSIILMGGYSGDSNRWNDVWRSTDQGATWTQMTGAASWSPRSRHTSVALPDDSIVLMSGYDGSYQTDVWRSTDRGATWTQMTAAADWAPRYSHTSVTLSDGSIVFMGGWHSGSLNDVWRSTDRGATWTQLTDDAGWSPRFVHTSVALPDDSILLMGGVGGGYQNDVWRSTNQGGAWTQITAAADWPARFGLTSVALSDDAIVLMGGYNGIYLNDVWQFERTD